MVKMQYVFYVLGIAFLFATVAYFSYEYLFELADIVKVIILVCITIVFFVVADIMGDRQI